MSFRERQKGEGKIGFLIGLTVLGIGIFLAVKVIPVRVDAYEFRDTIRQEARRAAIHGDVRKLAELILEKADELDIPLNAKNLEVRKTRSEMVVKAHYEQPIDLKVTTYVYKFEAEERAPLF